MLTKRFFLTILTGAYICLLVSCSGSKIYDNMQDMDSSVWNENKELLFQVSIPDTSTRYTLYYTIRYDNNYPFYNLYLNRELTDSTGKSLQKELQNMDLFNANTGIPYGDGMGSKKDFLILSKDNYKFPYPGQYTFKLRQYMRQENLPGIYAVGMRIDRKKEN